MVKSLPRALVLFEIGLELDELIGTLLLNDNVNLGHGLRDLARHGNELVQLFGHVLEVLRHDLAVGCLTF